MAFFAHEPPHIRHRRFYVQLQVTDDITVVTVMFVVLTVTVELGTENKILSFSMFRASELGASGAVTTSVRVEPVPEGH